jgi:PAS domain-containing protein
MQMREEGRSQDDAGVFEIDLVENKITWANDFAVERAGYTFDQVKHMTLFDLVPEAFHGRMQDAIAGASDKQLDDGEALAAG